VVVGDHPRVGTPFAHWHAVVPHVPAGPQMLLVSAVPAPESVAGLPGEWGCVNLDRGSLFDADHVVVRPDGYVAAVCDHADLAATLAALTLRLHALPVVQS
jgi:hypothetical protein